MRNNNLLVFSSIWAFCLLFFTSCEVDEEHLSNNLTETGENTVTETTKEELEVEEFIYSGMNELYLYKADVRELGDSYFGSDTEKYDFLGGFGSPEALFEDLLGPDDRFSFMTDDYNSLEDRFDGVSGSTGIKYGIGRISGTNNLFGYLQYILPNTSAEEQGLTRGTIFTEVDGQKLTENNFESLLSANSFTINIGKVKNNQIEMSDRTVTLENTSYTANPIFREEVLEVEGQKIGYLMYNSFIANFDDELNAAFGNLKAQGIQHLVLDLRYNGGGSVQSAVDLASMITGQFEEEVFMTEQWNEKYQAHFEAYEPERLVNLFRSTIRTGESINSLNLSEVYILTTRQTASASELIINGLEPYIDVVQIGDRTTGKFQASVTLYDSDDFTSKHSSLNPDHTYAIQPLVFKSANAEGKSDYVDGLAPDVPLEENLNEMGTLGDPSEPLLQAAIDRILGRPLDILATKSAQRFETVEESGMNEPDFQRMYIEEVPPILSRNKH